MLGGKKKELGNYIFLINLLTLLTLYTLWMALIGIYCLFEIVCKIGLSQSSAGFCHEWTGWSWMRLSPRPLPWSPDGSTCATSKRPGHLMRLRGEIVNTPNKSDVALVTRRLLTIRPYPNRNAHRSLIFLNVLPG